MPKTLSGIKDFNDGLGGDLSLGILTANEIILNGTILDPTINADINTLKQKTTNISYNSPITEIANSLTVDNTLSVPVINFSSSINGISTTIFAYISSLSSSAQGQLNYITSNYVLTSTLANYLLSSTASSTYATISSLSNYVLSSTLTTTLANYLLSSTASSTYATISSLSNYVLSSTLTTTLSNYVLSSTLTSTLANYVLSSTLTTTLANYLTTATAASTYLTQSNASSTYETQSHASSTYATQASLSTVSGVASGAAAVGVTNSAAIAALVISDTAQNGRLTTIDGEIITIQGDITTLQAKTTAISYSPATTSTTISGAQLSCNALSSGNYSLNGTFNFNNSLTQAGSSAVSLSGPTTISNTLTTNGLTVQTNPSYFQTQTNINGGCQIGTSSSTAMTVNSTPTFNAGLTISGSQTLFGNNITSNVAGTGLNIGRTAQLETLTCNGSSVAVNAPSINIGCNQPVASSNVINIGSYTALSTINLAGYVVTPVGSYFHQFS
jgi:hypothetical protein